MGKEVNLSVIILEGGKYDKAIYKTCLSSVAWAGEVIRLKTDQIKADFAELRNIGASKSKGKWLLYIDTDEEVTSKLRDEIQKVIQSEKFSGYAIPRTNIIFGKVMKNCGLWPDYVLRLIKKADLIQWEGELHEQPKLKGEIFYLSNSLIHHKHDNLADMVEKTNKWSEIEARLMYKSGHPKMNFVRFMSAGFREFWKRMVVQRAFMDGSYGVIYGIYQVFSRLISYSKLWEMQLSVNKNYESSDL